MTNRRSLNITFAITNRDPSDRELAMRQDAIREALNELSFPDKGQKPVNQLGEHGAHVHIDLNHKTMHAAIDIRGDQCTGGCTIGTVASAQSIKSHFDAVVVETGAINSVSVSVGGIPLDALKRKYQSPTPAPTAFTRRFGIFGR